MRFPRPSSSRIPLRAAIASFALVWSQGCQTVDYYPGHPPQGERLELTVDSGAVERDLQGVARLRFAVKAVHSVPPRDLEEHPFLLVLSFRESSRRFAVRTPLDTLRDTFHLAIGDSAPHPPYVFRASLYARIADSLLLQVASTQAAAP